MLRVSPDCTQYFAISTIFGVYRMLAAPMGFVNTPFIYQERIVAEILGGVENDSLFGRPHSGVLQWLDDSLVYSETFEQHLETMARLLENCRKKKLRLNIDKCDVIKREAVWCGRLISEEGWRFQSKYFDNILKLGVPRTLGQLKDCVYLSQWLSPGIPRVAEYKTDFMNLATEMKKELNSKSRAPRESGRQICGLLGIPLDAGTGRKKFQEFRVAIQKASESHLSLYSEQLDLYVLTDASKLYWSGVLASGLVVDTEKISNVLKHQGDWLSQELQMRPMYFISGAFKGSQYHWSMPDKEMFPILKILLRFRFLDDVPSARPENFLRPQEHGISVKPAEDPKSSRYLSPLSMGVASAKFQNDRVPFEGRVQSVRGCPEQMGPI